MSQPTSLLAGLAQDATLLDMEANGIPDASPPLVPLAPGGQDVSPAASAILIAAASGRVKVEVNHSGTAGRLWLGLGQPAVVGVGNYLDPGEYWAEFCVCDVRVLLAGTSSAQRITWQEWAA